MPLALSTEPLEVTSAATDTLVVAVALAAAALLRVPPRPERHRARIWTCVFGLVAFSACLGAVAHGFALSQEADARLWHVINFALGQTVALFGVGVLHDWAGPAVARRGAPIFVALGLGFFVYRAVTASSFLAFIVFEVTVMVAALACYTWIAAARRRAGAAWMALGVLVTIAAAAVQSNGPRSFRLGWEFDRNGLFHLIQIPGLALLLLGLRRGPAETGSRPRRDERDVAR